MKRYLILLLLLIASPSFAQWQEAKTSQGILGGGAAGAATNYCNDANAMGCWYMNADGSTAETDRTVNGNDLTVSSADTIPQSATVPAGYSGYSRDFELTDEDYLEIADGTELDINGANAALSIVAWIKPESAVNTVNQAVVAKFNAGTAQRQYLLYINGTGTDTYKVQGYISSDGGSTNKVLVASTTTNYATGTWYHVGMVYNDTDLRVYVNGSLDCTPGAFTSGIFDGSATFVIGKIINDYYFDGLIDEVAVFNRELSSTEINNIYTNGLTGNKGGSD